MLTADARLQISDTLARQAFLVDENRLDQLDEVFTTDATYDMTSSGMGRFEGLEALRSAAGQLFASGHAPLSHFVTNIVIEETGTSTTSVRSKGLMIMHDGGVHGVVYDDTFTLEDGRWLIASRVILPLRDADGDQR
jgi:hypothetical protein